MEWADSLIYTLIDERRLEMMATVVEDFDVEVQPIVSKNDSFYSVDVLLFSTIDAVYTNRIIASGIMHFDTFNRFAFIENEDSGVLEKIDLNSKIRYGRTEDPEVHDFNGKQWADSVTKVILANDEFGLNEMMDDEIELNYFPVDSHEPFNYNIEINLTAAARPEEDLGSRVVYSSKIMFDTILREVFLMDIATGDMIKRE